MGESKLKLAKREEMLLSRTGVQTMAGRVRVCGETETSWETPTGAVSWIAPGMKSPGTLASMRV